MSTFKSGHWVILAVSALAVFILASCAASQEASRSWSEYVAEHGATVAASPYASEADLL